MSDEISLEDDPFHNIDNPLFENDPFFNEDDASGASNTYTIQTNIPVEPTNFLQPLNLIQNLDVSNNNKEDVESWVIAVCLVGFVIFGLWLTCVIWTIQLLYKLKKTGQKPQDSLRFLRLCSGWLASGLTCGVWPSLVIHWEKQERYKEKKSKNTI